MEVEDADLEQKTSSFLDVVPTNKEKEALSESEWEEDENEKQPRPIFESLTPEPEIKSAPRLTG